MTFLLFYIISIYPYFCHLIYFFLLSDCYFYRSQVSQLFSFLLQYLTLFSVFIFHHSYFISTVRLQISKMKRKNLLSGFSSSLIHAFRFWYCSTESQIFICSQNSAFVLRSVTLCPFYLSSSNSFDFKTFRFVSLDFSFCFQISLISDFFKIVIKFFHLVFQEWHIIFMLPDFFLMLTGFSFFSDFWSLTLCVQINLLRFSDFPSIFFFFPKIYLLLFTEFSSSVFRCLKFIEIWEWKFRLQFRWDLLEIFPFWFLISKFCFLVLRLTALSSWIRFSILVFLCLKPDFYLYSEFLVFFCRFVCLSLIFSLSIILLLSLCSLPSFDSLSFLLCLIFYIYPYFCSLI